MIEPERAKPRTAFLVTALGAVVPVVCLAIPLYVIRPFRPQAPRALALALTVRQAAPWVSAVCAIAALAAAWWAWNCTRRMLARITMVMFCAIAVAGAFLTHINIFEIMFHPYGTPVFESWQSAHLPSDDRVLAVKIGNQSRAYPIRAMGYHHIVNDTIAGVPIAVTYCTLCHTGLVWNRILDGKTLYFRLTGINNGNALMRDEQTGSIWQQSTGLAIFGPLQGKRLELVPSDELSAALWHKEQPDGEILKPYARYASEYDPKDWENHVEKTPVVVDTSRSQIPPHELMLGLSAGGIFKAYAVRTILAERLVRDQIAGEPILLVVGSDRTSIRVFQAGLEGQNVKFALLTGHGANTLDQPVMTDAATGSLWNFQGCAIEGPQSGRCLRRIDANKDYWFDWLNHHPATAVFRE